MYSQYHCTLNVRCSTISPMMITIHQRNRNVSNDDDTFSKSTQNSLPWVLPDKYITDQLTIQLILSLPIFLLLIPPIHEYVTVQKMQCSVSTGDKQFTNEQTSNIKFPLISKFPVLNISLFSAKSGHNSCRKVPCFTNKVLECYKHVFQIFLKSPYSLDDKIRTTVQLITYTVLQNCLSLFTIHIQNCSIFVRFSSEAELQIFSWGSSLE